MSQCDYFWWPKNCQKKQKALHPVIRTLLPQCKLMTTLNDETTQVAPWVGMTMVTQSSDELSLIASNAAGELFCCDVGLGEGEEAGEGASEADLFSVDDTRGRPTLNKQDGNSSNGPAAKLPTQPT